MAKNPVSIKNFINLCKILPEWKSILVRANHGVGKSEIVSQIADYFRETNFNGQGFPLIDRRLSQMSEGDVIGLPKVDGETTVFLPPDWFVQACKEPVCLFLDELNRATPEVMQAAFQIVLDRQMQGHKLHPQTRVYAAINAGCSYTVNEVDPALLDRFWCVDLEASVEEWLEWANTREDICSTIKDFVRVNEGMLDSSDKAELGTVQPSRRSWHHLSRALLASEISDKPADPLFYPMCLGFIGLEATMAFVDYCKTYQFALTAEDIIEKLVKKCGPIKYNKKKFDTIDAMAATITDEDDKSEAVIDVVRLIARKDENGKDIDPTKYDDAIVKRLGEMGQERVNALTEKVAEYVKDKYANQTLSDTQGAALAKFASLLPGEIRLVLWQKIMERGIDDMTLNASIHRWLAAQILNIFDMELGKRGMEMTPNIPSYLQQS